MSTTPETPLALTDEQIVERLAVEVMGWKKKTLRPLANGIGWPEYAWFDDAGKTCWLKDWNPLTSWDNWRQVEEKVMEDEKVWNEYLNKMCWDGLTAPTHNEARCIMNANLPTRCRALLSALDSQ